MKGYIKKHSKHSMVIIAGSGLLTIALVISALAWATTKNSYAGAFAVKRHPSHITAGSSTQTATSSSSSPASSTLSQPSSSQTSSANAPSSATPTPSSALHGQSLYVDPSRASLPSPLNSEPVASWLGSWSGDVHTAANSLVSRASAAGSLATLVAYNIPVRDCGSYSAGGADSSSGYQQWIQSLAAGIGQRQAIVILEPDALAQINCLSANDQTQRLSDLAYAVSTLASTTKAFIYIDAGHSNWIDATTMAGLLQKANIAQAAGFSLNVSNFETTANNTTYGNQISSLVDGKHFIIDTGRNGNGPGDTWCNPAGRALGALPTTNTTGNVDAYLWVKVPGESDGTCNGGPSAGTYWPEYALSLIANTH